MSPRNHIQDSLSHVLDTCVCPFCYGKLKNSGDDILCHECDFTFPVLNGIPVFISKNDMSHKNRKLSSLYDKSTIKHHGSYKSCGYSGKNDYLSRLNIIKRWIDFENINGKKIIDIGCGTGLMTEQLVQRNEVWGIDISLGLLGFAEKKGLKTSLASAAKLPYAHNTFDMAICIGVIPYYNNPSDIFSELFRVTRPGGRIVVSSTADSFLIRFVRFIKNISGGFSQLAHLYTTAEIEGFLTLRGAKILDACTGYKENVFSVIDKPPPFAYRLLSRANAVLAETAK